MHSALSFISDGISAGNVPGNPVTHMLHTHMKTILLNTVYFK